MQAPRSSALLCKVSIQWKLRFAAAADFFRFGGKVVGVEFFIFGGVW